ncbi:hypothetical protein B0T25DRAFT_316716 [Lasiosphaeria hispida]|uniref:HIT-type domain-containing protein n=1 Tax=Lasiosphaeria hispida TaxID=260671 RepID=A0AAJ0M9J5_9PEZI|nr:hypothetical protein B0T25DRAFT_316716 [Lasiosphaeria hispida]
MSPPQSNGGAAPLSPSAAVRTDETPAPTGPEAGLSDSSTAREDETTTTTVRRRPPPCGVCNKDDAGKYKCPRCPLAYCSVACNRIHKENHPPTEQQPSPPNHPTETPLQSHTGPVDPYSILLEHRSEFDRLFNKYPRLESELFQIQETTLPPSDSASISSGATLPLKLPQQYPGGGGGGSGGGKRQPMWTREVGLRKGAAALRKARTDPGDRGDGVREYCELVLYLLAQNKTAAATQGSRPGRGPPLEVPDATSLVRQEIMAEEARTVERLLREEGGMDMDR